MKNISKSNKKSMKLFVVSSSNFKVGSFIEPTKNLVEKYGYSTDCVLASNVKVISITRIIEFFPYTLGYYIHKNKFYIVDHRFDSFKKLNKKKGYIYTVDSRELKKVDDFNYISDRRVKILEKESFINALDELKKYSVILIDCIKLEKCIKKFLIKKIKKVNMKLENNKILYHGSPYKITKNINPMPTGEVNNEKVVFATQIKGLAMLFTSRWSDQTIELTYNDDNDIYWYMIEKKPKAFDIFKGNTGYVYHLDSKNFKQDKRIGLYNYAFISRQKEPILKTEKYNDCLKALENSSVNMITYKQFLESIEKVK